MVRRYSLRDVLVEVPGLTEERLVDYIQAGAISPVQADHGPLFRDVDIARLNLLVDLADGFELDDEALLLVMSLVDQLHGLRGDMRAILTAVAQEPLETRARLSRAIHDVRVVIHR